MPNVLQKKHAKKPKTSNKANRAPPYTMFTFKKKERLCSKTLIERLYASNNKTLVYPLSVRWLFVDDDRQASRLQVLIVAPKKKLRHAVDRNRTKRILRECYRLRKNTLIDILSQNKRYAILSVNYIDTKVPDFHKMESVFDRLADQLKEAFENDKG